ncbi:complex I 51 kDa subunit family protein [Turneriella parva]|uniref:NAD(P)-dependent iron-only hydrogenase diaphorase component flavoprotein n=1 Tax=Turneriella parva (strain ATCC BAA-1111 / DSM 21527 / NCTC 11395 / H) TaxID=869212 RepID=I4B7X8_TURPD|nr:NADH-ubiquinone oxidoreductase-F iron-sulfur binding region domain-containing protein [Turneriella parva]AFM13385.1 NAD(P)-dependent iron-only hydrogenase diaphorase component flavoprotein [Turneriella parva DSM 21527]
MKEPSGLIRVALDSGGIAAGAAAVFDELRELTAKYSEIKVIAVGTPGMCYADAQAEFLIEGRPHLHFGRLTRQNVRQIFEEFVVKGRMPAPNSVHEYVVLGARSPGHELPQAVASIVCADTQQHGDQDLVALLKACVGPETEIIEVADFGFYNRGFALQFFPGGLMLADLARDDIAHAVAMVRRGEIPDVGTVVKEAAQLRIASRNCGLVDPESIAAYEAAGGYTALKRALQMSPAKVVNEVLASGLRGRGGAGFSTGKKWQLSAAETADEKYVICNGDEGDPGAFMDRSLLEGDPHCVLEGLIIAGLATGANQGYFYIRAEYPLATARVQKAIDAAVSAGYLGKNILGSSFSFEARVRLGAGAYVCGEETALIASVEGKRGSPHPRPPYPSVSGLHRAPTTINNVETLATVPEILVRGGAWYAGIGEGKSKGTKLFAVSGKIRRTQLVEVPLGTSVREVVENLCGGIATGKKIKAVQTGGPSGGFVPQQLLDTPLTYEDMSALGSIIGSGGMIVLDEDVNMVELMRFYLGFNTDESCGLCAPCRIGGFQLKRLYDKLLAHDASHDDLAQIEKIAHAMQSASLCGLGKSAPSPLFATLKYFHPEYEACLK